MRSSNNSVQQTSASDLSFLLVISLLPGMHPNAELRLGWSGSGTEQWEVPCVQKNQTKQGCVIWHISGETPIAGSFQLAVDIGHIPNAVKFYFKNHLRRPTTNHEEELPAESVSNKDDAVKDPKEVEEPLAAVEEKGAPDTEALKTTSQIQDTKETVTPQNNSKTPDQEQVELSTDGSTKTELELILHDASGQTTAFTSPEPATTIQSTETKTDSEDKPQTPILLGEGW